ncbi:MAG TPA: SoxR reducing system RseC family protein [Arenimonas sp.]|nr:SoxR reducing system RseC family protein [Arenimonas sp.]
MAERRARLLAVEAGQLRLQLLGSACSGCGGCGGRCNLFQADGQGELRLPAPADFQPSPGQDLLLSLDDAGLRRLAWRGYGLALLGLMAGAVLGRGLAALLDLPADPCTAIGLLAGTFLAVRLSKQRLPAPALRPCDATPAGPVNPQGASPP